MKHTLPWNVTGIPPEAREIARSAASREGATVGEWLTRRIMTEQANKAPPTEPDDALTPPFRYPHDEAPPRPRSEIASETVAQRIDEAFRALARRLEDNERAQNEAQRSMRAAAAEINAATRDQAEAFQHLTTRIDRVERHADTGALRDAVRGLHQGLSRLADGIAKTSNESSGKISALGGAVEALAEKMAATQDDSEHRFHTVGEKLAALDARMARDEERTDHTAERIASAARLNKTVTALENRMNAIEQRVQDSLGHYLTGIERSLDEIGERLQQTEAQSRSDGGLADAVRSLTARFEALENDSRAPAEVESAPDETELSPAPVEDAAPASDPAAGEVSEAEFSLPPTSDESLFGHTHEAPSSKEDVPTAPDEPATHAPPAAAENYLAHARRAARPDADGSMRSRIRPDFAESGQRRRMLRSLAAGLLVVLLLGTGAVLTRSNQGRANALALNSSNLIALGAPKANSVSAPAPLPTAPAQDTITAASVFPFGNAGTTPLALLMARATGGDAKAAMQLGLKYADGDGVAVNETQAAYWLQKAAEASQAVAQYRLGTLYERGLGVAADARQAIRWYGEAASHGNLRAMHNLAIIYADGTGTEKNFSEAARLFRDAAELGLTDSQFNLAVLYERGLGVRPSLAEAYKWYAIAAESGDAESKARLAALAGQIAQADRDAADKAAKAYKPRPVDIAANDG